MTDSTRTVVIILLIFAAWEFVPRATGITPLLFPPFSAVLGALLRNLNPTTGGPLWGYTYTTVSILFVSYVLSIVIAMCLATWATMSVWGRDFLKVITSVFQPLPAVALLPLAIVWFGLNTQSLIFVVIMAMLWPLAASLSTGFGTVPLTRIRVGRNLELSTIGLVARILLPSALPSIFNGLRISWGYGWRTIVAAELVFGSTAQGQGLGHFINTSRIYLATDEAMAGILMVIILGLLFETLFRILQRETTMRWGMER